MFDFIARFFTKRLIAKNKKKESVPYTNWDSVKSIAFIIDVHTTINKSKLDAFFAQLNKYFSVYLVETNKSEPTFSDWSCITKKQKSIFGLPKKELFEKLKAKNYDVLVCVNPSDNTFTSNLCASIHAGLRCGSNDTFGELDLIIASSNKELIAVLEECVRYLKMIKKQ
ncbi:MAG: hypothetical protein IPM51_02390 [Sphingobacteriaceae bacterium]|nr:hypothetical protein [Sphingobacteriaceae bacterium]